MLQPNVKPGTLAEDPEFMAALRKVLDGLHGVDSYHADILDEALKTEIDRGKTYSHSGTGHIEWSEFELIYLYGAIYKLLRIKNTCTSVEKALDDAKDAYNYCALFYRYVMKNRVPGPVGDAKVAVAEQLKALVEPIVKTVEDKVAAAPSQ